MQINNKLMKIYVIFIFINSIILTQGQCAMCKSTVESNAKMEITNRAQGLNYGILYLMTIPYILFGTLGYFWYRHSKKTKANRQRIEAAVKNAL